MSSIDDRVVAMKFDNGQFERGVSQTTGSLEKLKKSLNFSGANKGLGDLQGSANKLNLGGIGTAVEGISAKFMALSTIAITALANITNKAIDAGLSLAKSFSLDPIIEGFQEYELKMGSIQTILANTERHGTGLEDVSAALDELNTYADDTIYNFGDMTKNIGLFTNAGIKVEDATAMIKGFSNMAAASGTSAQGAAGAAYQLSQALSTGTIRLMDWRSLTNVGMGNKNMQLGIVEIADAMGELDKAGISATEVTDDFNGSLEKNWLSADVMSHYLKIMAGEMTEAEQAALGLSEAQIKAFAGQQQTALDAATKVRTYTQLVDTLKEGVGSSWAGTMDILIGDFDQATELWSGVSDTLGDMIDAMGDSRNEMLQGWSDLGGRDVAIEGFKAAWEALGAAIKPIKDAFREIFPAKTSQDLYSMTVAFRDFMQNIKIGGETAENLKRTFKGVFAVFSIGWQILKGIGRVIANVFSALAGDGEILGFTASVGDMVVKLDEAMKKGEGLTKFFEGLGKVVAYPIGIIKSLASALGSLFSSDTGVNPGSIAEAFENLKNRLSPIFDWFKEMFGKFKDWLLEGLSSDTFDASMSALSATLLGGIALLIRKFVKGGFEIDLTGGLLGGIRSSLEALTDTLSAMQQNLKANILLKLAFAIGILAASVYLMSRIDPGDLARAMTAIGVSFALLVGAMTVLALIPYTKGFIKIPLIAAALLMLSGAVLILAFAANKLSGLDWNELAKGLTGIGVILGFVVATAKLISGSSGALIRAGLGMLAISIAVNRLADAVKTLAALSWSELARGLTAMAGALLALVGAAKLMPKNITGIGLGLALLSIGIKVLADAVVLMAGLSWDEIGRGLLTLVGALGAIAGAMHLMPPNMVGTAASLVLIGIAINLISSALGKLGGMSWTEIAKGLVALAGSLVVLAGGMFLINKVKGGALALTAIALALALFLPVLITLGNMSWGEILTSLAALAGVFVVIGLAGLLLTPIIPTLLALSTAMLTMGYAFVTFGAGAALLAKAFEIVVASGSAGVQVLIELLAAVLGVVPQIFTAIGEGIVAFATAIYEGAPEIMKAISEIVAGLIKVVITNVPLLAEAFIALIAAALDVLVTSIPAIVHAGGQILAGFLKGIADNIGSVVNEAVNVVVNFLNGIGNNIGKIIQAGFDLAIKFLDGVADGIKNNMNQVVQSALGIGKALVQGIWKGITNLAGWLWDKVTGWMSDIWDGILGYFGIESPSKQMAWVAEMLVRGLGGGIDKDGQLAVDSAVAMSKNVMSSVTDTLSDMPHILDGMIDSNPTIVPVLDLTQVKSEAAKMNDILDHGSLSSDLAFSNASSISSDAEAYANDLANASTEPAVTQEIKFEQVNNSPKALSSVEIYRQTRNQIAMAKEALATT